MIRMKQWLNCLCIIPRLFLSFKRVEGMRMYQINERSSCVQHKRATLRRTHGGIMMQLKSMCGQWKEMYHVFAYVGVESVRREE